MEHSINKSQNDFDYFYFWCISFKKLFSKMLQLNGLHLSFRIEKKIQNLKFENKLKYFLTSSNAGNVNMDRPLVIIKYSIDAHFFCNGFLFANSKIK